MDTEKLAKLSIDLFSAPEEITVRSDAFDPNDPMPDWTSAYFENLSPPLDWDGVPEDAKAIVLMVEDPDAHRMAPFEHWLYVMPPDVHGLPRGVPIGAIRKDRPVAVQEGNDYGISGYFGPRPPREDRPHHYHFQVFATDEWIYPEPGLVRGDILEKMEGHVIAKGELVGTFRAP